MSNATQRTFLGHPLGLYVLFFTEMWERFSYYGMRALLILYMVNYFRWSQKDASTIYKVYTSFVYVTPILGGFLADRYLGNKIAVIIGALMMAVGQFALGLGDSTVYFYWALVLLILGNGMFKPNMSTQVGRLYPINDGRRDGAYTIFYMGINIGACLASILCGWLADNTVGEYQTGFAAAGIGMVLGLSIYLLGQPLIHEIPVSEPAPSKTGDPQQTPTTITILAGNRPPNEAEAERVPSVLGGLSPLAPKMLLLLAVLLMAGAPLLWRLEKMGPWDALMLGIAGFCLLLFAHVCAQVGGGVRDRVLAILILGVFVMFFWAAFEQAGNVFNLWADKSTNRYLTQAPKARHLKPEAFKARAEKAPVEESLLDRLRAMFQLKPRPEQTWDQWLREALNPMPTPWFQSINALAIFVIAPFFAWLWVALDSRGWQPSIPLKMFLGLVFMSLAMAVMMAAANQENQFSSVALQGDKLPEALTVQDGKIGVRKDGRIELFHAGRLTWDAKARTLNINGVLTDNEANSMIEAAAPADYRKKVEQLRKESEKIANKQAKAVEVDVERTPPGFDMTWAGLDPSAVHYNSKQHKLVAGKEMADKEVKGLLTAGGEPRFRATVEQLYIASNQYRVSPWWLFWTYILATLGELCLSPVGLSMVSKLAPAKFATMLMGVWMLTSAFGNFIAGALGEIWGTIPPVQFFLLSASVVAGAAVVLLVLVKLVTRTMHGVK